jgi:hypothetical protein
MSDIASVVQRNTVGIIAKLPFRTRTIFLTLQLEMTSKERTRSIDIKSFDKVVLQIAVSWDNK